MDLVVITWEDIETHIGWHDCQANEFEPPVFKTVGYLFFQNRKKLVICDTEAGEGNVTVFPAGCVKKIEVIKTIEEIVNDD